MRSIYIPYLHTGELVEKPSGVAWGTALFPRLGDDKETTQGLERVLRYELAS